MGKITSPWIFYLSHFISYQSVWILCILLGANEYIWLPFAITLGITTLQLLLHRMQRPLNKGLILFTLLYLISGFLGDSFLNMIGAIHFNSNVWKLTPPFMLGLWLNFAVTFHCTLLHLNKRYGLLTVLSIVGFPLAYGLGAQLGAAQINAIGLLCVSILWAILFPGTMFIYNLLRD